MADYEVTSDYVIEEGTEKHTWIFVSLFMVFPLTFSLPWKNLLSKEMLHRVNGMAVHSKEIGLLIKLP